MGRAAFGGDMVGTTFKSRRWLSLNACGLAGISCTFSLHAYSILTIAFNLISDSPVSQTIFFCLYVPIAFLAVWSLFMAWTTNPGAVPMGARPLVRVVRAESGDLESARTRAIRRCHKCNDNYKPDRAHHDSVTGRCIVKMDHYCPWVCNAVGALNHKFFVLFVFYTMNSCIVTLCMIFFRSIRCGFQYEMDSEDEAMTVLGTSEKASYADPDDPEDLDQGRFLKQAFVYSDCETFYSNHYIGTLFFIAITFLIFTACMFVEQIEAIETNQGKIARMKMRVGRGGTELTRVTEEFNEMFGGNSPKFSWHWLLPLPVRFPGSMKKVVLGYEWDPSFDAVPYKQDDEENDSTENIDGKRQSSGDLSIADIPPVESSLTNDMEDITLEDSSVHSNQSAGMKKRAKSRDDAGEMA